MITRYEEKYENELIKFYRYLTKKNTFWLDASNEEIRKSFFEDVDRFKNEKFNKLETYLYVTKDGNVQGFIQYGEPAYIYINGKRIIDDNVGIIRNIYCCKSTDVIHELLDLAIKWFKENNKSKIHCFYKELGFSTAYSNGMLIDQFIHIDEGLNEYGFEIEAEHSLFGYPLYKEEENSLEIRVKDYKDFKSIDLYKQEEHMGFIEITTYGASNLVYLTKIEIFTELLMKEYGVLFFDKIINHLLAEGFLFLFADANVIDIKRIKFFQNAYFALLGRL